MDAGAEIPEIEPEAGADEEEIDLDELLAELESATNEEVEEEVTEEVEEKEDEEEALEARDPNESIPMINLLSADQDKLQHGDLVNYNEKMFRVTKIATGQSPIFKFLEVDADGQDCDNVLNVKADDISQVEKIETKASEDEGSEDQSQELHIKYTKEIDMAEQVVDTPIVLDTGASEKKASEEIKKEAAPIRAEVSEPEVAELVEKTGEAIIKEAGIILEKDVISNQNTEPEESQEDSNDLKKLSIKELKLKLNETIENEDYELASKIRDEINRRS